VRACGCGRVRGGCLRERLACGRRHLRVYGCASLTPLSHPLLRMLHPSTLPPLHPFKPPHTDLPIRSGCSTSTSATLPPSARTQTKRRQRIWWSGRSSGAPWRQGTATRCLRSPPPFSNPRLRRHVHLQPCPHPHLRSHLQSLNHGPTPRRNLVYDPPQVAIAFAGLPTCVTRVVLGMASAEQVRSISIGGPAWRLRFRVGLPRL